MNPLTRRLLTPTLFYGALVLASLATALHRELALPALLSAVFAGLVIYSVVEYCVHRWIQHTPLYRKLVRDDDHGHHHQRPDDLTWSVYPLKYSLGILSPSFVLGPGLTQDAALGLGIIAGVMMGYLLYEWIHMAAHHPAWAPAPWVQRLARNHRLHHRNARVGFGFITPVWDRLLGTYPPAMPEAPPGP